MDYTVPRGGRVVVDVLVGGDRGWLAALIDTRGGIGIHRLSDGLMLRVVVGMTDEAVIRRAHDIAGVGRVSVERRPAKALFRWSVEHRKAHDLVLELAPYFVRKAPHVEVVRTLYAHGMMGRADYLKGGVSNEMWKIREGCYDAMRWLNFCGKGVRKLLDDSAL